MHTSPISWKILLLESSFIVLGVVIALGANEMREAYQDRNRAEDALRNMGAELCRNYTFLSPRVDYFTLMSDTLRVAYRTTADSVFRRANFPQYRGGMPILLTSAAFDVAVASNVLPHLDQELAGGLAQIYEMQEMSELFQQRFLDAALNGNLETVADNLLYFSELSTIGGEVLRGYQEAFTVLPGVPEACLTPPDPTP